MNKIKEIVLAYSKKLQQRPEDVERANLRYEKCVECSSRIHLFRLELCKDCGCPLEGKIFSPKGKEECPQKKWEI